MYSNESDAKLHRRKTELTYFISNEICELKKTDEESVALQKSQELVKLGEEYFDIKIEIYRRKEGLAMQLAFSKAMSDFEKVLNNNLAETRKEFAETRKEFAETRKEVQEVRSEMNAVHAEMKSSKNYNMMAFIAIVVGVIGFFVALATVVSKAVGWIP